MGAGSAERAGRVHAAAALRPAASLAWPAAALLAAALLAAASPAAASPAAAPAATAASEGAGPPPPGRMTVFVSILPYAWLVARIGGDRVAVEVLVEPGQSPETYEPSPRQLARLGEAAALVRAGVPFERALLPRLARTFPNLPVVDPLAGLQLLPWEDAGAGATDGRDHGHGDGRDHGHDHGDFDPHAWLDPVLARGAARNLAAALARLDPAHAAEFEARRGDLDAELVALEQELAAQLAPWRGRTFYVFHPAFGYFAARFGLRQAAIQSGGREPTPRQLAAVIDAARRDGARALFVQPQYSPRSARKVADALGAELVPLDDLARDYPDNLRRLAAALAAGFSPGASVPASGSAPAAEAPR